MLYFVIIQFKHVLLLSQIIMHQGFVEFNAVFCLLYWNFSQWILILTQCHLKQIYAQTWEMSAEKRMLLCSSNDVADSWLHCLLLCGLVVWFFLWLSILCFGSGYGVGGTLGKNNLNEFWFSFVVWFDCVI